MDEAEADAVVPVRRARVRVTVGAAVVLVVVAAGIAVLVSLLAPRGVQATISRDATVRSVAPRASDSAAQLVHVVGAVRSPGLYSVPPGSRVIDAIAAAGGFTAKADQAGLNLARPVADGEQLVVPVKGAGSAARASGGAVEAGGTVALNTADLAALDSLDGIGPALAQRILDYRQAHGGFRSITDLQKVAGIGDKKFAAIKDHVTL